MDLGMDFVKAIPRTNHALRFEIQVSPTFKRGTLFTQTFGGV